jgi:hypothetical protein
MSNERLGSSVVWLIDVPFTVKNAFVRGKRSRVFNCVSVMRPHEHMGGLQGEMEWGAQFLRIFEPLHGVNIVRSVATSGTQVVGGKPIADEDAPN